MSESQYIPDPDELEDDAAGEQDELYEHYSITADRGQSPLRLDKFLTIHMERCSRNRIQTAADAGNILVNGKPAKSSYKVKPGDRISLVMPYPKREIEIIPENIPLEIPYEDDDLLLVNKPAGMVVHPGHGNYSATLVNALTYYLQNLPLFQEGDMRAGLVHRIDKNTSGLLVIAKNERAPHPRYRGRGDIPAWEMIKHSVNIHRGCFGGCSFCTISAHQGKFITSRSEKSILREVERVTRMPDFRGYLSDIGAPSANMYRMGGRDRELCSKCRRPSCLHPKMCPNLDNDHRPLLDLYAKVRAVKGVKKAFIGSGIRYDLFDGSDYLDTVIRHHTSGRLKVAPEHTEDAVLKLMRKPPFVMFERLNADFNRICRREGLPYQLIPYFISSHPGCTERDMRSLADKVLGKLHFDLEQVQDLTPTPMTFSSVMFYTGENPYTGEKVYVARSQEEKRRQKSYFFRRKR